jgi:hypothetical protein
MSNDVAEQLLREIKEMRAEIQEMRTVLFDDAEEDSLDAYADPEAIQKALLEAETTFGERIA